ncbi:MAG: ABC transporter ATP-binding protein [Clostridia bacterium]|nr:ABC transporter ATP-binding protein [Clostridia bacterium]
MIKVESATKYFGDVCSLDEVTLQIPDGSIFGLIGSNGSGKSTLLRAMSGIFAVEEGRILFDGCNIWENTEQKAKLVYLSDEPYFLPHSSIEDMRNLFRSLYPTFDSVKFDKLLNLFGLPLRRKINTFSKGMQKQTSVLLGLSVCPKYLFCDETFDGLDPVMRHLVKRILMEDIAESGTTVVMASHNLRELEDICDHIALLHKGKLLFQNDLDDMKLSIQKIQAVFTEADAEEKLREMPLLNLERRGSMFTIVARGTREEWEERLQAMHPQFYECIPLTLEEIFIAEMEENGYDFTEILA